MKYLVIKDGENEVPVIAPVEILQNIDTGIEIVSAGDVYFSGMFVQCSGTFEVHGNVFNSRGPHDEVLILVALKAQR